MFPDRPRLGSVSGALGLTKFLEGHDFVVTSSKDGPDSVFEKELPDADVVPFVQFPLNMGTSKMVKNACSNVFFEKVWCQAVVSALTFFVCVTTNRWGHLATFLACLHECWALWKSQEVEVSWMLFQPISLNLPGLFLEPSKYFQMASSIYFSCSQLFLYRKRFQKFSTICFIVFSNCSFFGPKKNPVPHLPGSASPRASARTTWTWRRRRSTKSPWRRWPTATPSPWPNTWRGGN